MHANQREEIIVYAGDTPRWLIRSKTFTGDTPMDQHNPVVLETIKFPDGDPMPAAGEPEDR